MKHIAGSFRKRSKPIVSFILSFILVLTGIPFSYEINKVVHADTTLKINPNQIKSVYGERTDIEWTYRDIPHQTKIGIVDGDNYTYVIEEGKTYSNGPDPHVVTWDGKVNGKPIEEGTYTIRVQPMEEQFQSFYAEGDLTVSNPNPPAPILEIVPDLKSDTHIIRGIAEKGTKVTLEIAYTKRQNYDQIPGETETIREIEVKERTSSWALAYDVSNYFNDFPRYPGNAPEDYVGEWEVRVHLHAYEIANITATAQRDMDGKESGKSDALRVLRYEAPDYNVTWEALAGYYYRADSIPFMREKIREIADFNGIKPGQCYGNQECFGWIGKGTNLLIKNPELAGLILKEELNDLTPEKIANRKKYAKPLWWDPINLATGDFIFTQSLFNLQARIPLSFDITYHSRDNYDGSLGVGWHHSYEWRLEKREEEAMYLMTPDGAVYGYIPAGNGEYRTPAGTYDKLEKLANGMFALTTPQRWLYTFREDGLLVHIEDPNHNRVDLTYKGTVLEQVSTDGAAVTFTYGTGGKVERITDHSGRTVQFRYDDLTHDLRKVILPDGAEIGFTYDDQHQLTEISNPRKTSTLINVYDDQGRVIRQRDFAGAWGEIEYHPEEKKTITRDPYGRAKVFEYDDRFRQTAIHYPDGTVERFEYDMNDNLTRFTDRNGHTWRYVYDLFGNLIQSIDPLGAVTDIQYNEFNLPAKVTDPLGNKTIYAYDANGNVISITNPLGEVSVIKRDSYGIPTQIINPEGEKITLTNDPLGFVKKVTDPAGVSQELNRDPLHRVTEIIDALGNVSKFVYDPRDRVLSRIDALDQRERYDYDKDSNLISITDASGAKTIFTYDHFDRVVAVTDPLNQVTRYSYDLLGNLIEEIDPNGSVTQYAYDDSGRLTQITDPEGHVTRFAYDGNGNLLSREDPNGGRIEITYDARNLPVTITDAEGAATTYTYDALGRLIQETNALGYSTYYTYDAAGRLIKQTDALGHTTQLEYDKAGRIRAYINENGAIWQLRYDERGLLQSITDPIGNISSLTRDPLGRVTESKDPNGAITTYAYDPLGRVTSIIDALGNSTSFAYDPVGRIKQVTDAKQQVTFYEYDPIGQLVAVINALGARTSYSYDKAGNIISKTDALGRLTSYKYNKNNQLIEETNPLGLSTKVAYDGNGNPVQVLFPDHTVTNYQYDRMNRLTEILYHDGKSVSYEYDLLGRRTKMIDSTGITTYAYDALNRLIRVTDARNQTIQYEWTPTGQRSKVIYPDQSVVSYQYDLLDRIISVQDGRGDTTQYTYDANGLITSKVYPNQAVSTYRYDALGQLIELKHTNQWGKELERLLYAYDPVGNRIRTERVEDSDDEDKKSGEEKEYRDPVITEYAYDAINQLTQVKVWNGTTRTDPITTYYTYDGVGNRLMKKTVWADLEDLEEYTYNPADQLIHWQNGLDYKDYIYDLRGNLLQVTGFEYEEPEETVTQSVYDLENLLDLPPDLLSVVEEVYGIAPYTSEDNRPKVLETYVWDSDNRLIQQTNQWGDISRFEYDGDGNRVKMTIDIEKGPNGRGNGKGNGKGKGNGNGKGKCHVVPPGFIPPGLAKKCGLGEDPEPVEHPGGPRDGWEKQYKKKHWEFYYTHDASLALPEVIQVSENDPSKWKQTYVYGALGERISMTYLPAYDHDNGWEPSPGEGGAEPGVTPKTLYYLQDILGSNIGLMERDGRMSARYHYDEFGIPLDRKKFDINWPGPDNLNGYTGLEYDYYTDLTYARARYYKAEIGRFISEDAYKGDLWNPQSQNLYVYVWNNPLLFVDPTGNWPSWSDIWNGGKEVADFLLLDDIRTLADPNASWGDKAWALAGFIPIGKFIKGGKIIAKTGEEVLEESNKIIKSVKKEKGNNYSNYFDKNSATKGTGKLSTRDTLLNAVSNQKLKNAIDQMYRPGATIGDGGLADAIRHELSTGQLVGGKSHIQKGIERVRNLENIIKKENLNPNDLATAQKLLDDLKDALQIK